VMRNLVVVAVTAALLTVVSGCARQVYYYSPYPNDSYYPDNSYSSDPDYSEPDPEPYGGSYPNGYRQGYGYYGGPYRAGYAEYSPRSSSLCWEPGRGRLPCNPPGP